MADIPLIPNFDTNWDYHNPTGVEFPIMASDARPSYPNNKMCVNGIEVDQYVQKCEFERLRKCGFNLVRISDQYWKLEGHCDQANGTRVGISACTKEVNHALHKEIDDLTIEEVTNYYIDFLLRDKHGL